MIPAEYIRRLEGDRECIDALACLADRPSPYEGAGFTPPLTRLRPSTAGTKFCALVLRIGRLQRLSTGSRIARADMYDGRNALAIQGSPAEIAEAFAARILNDEYSGRLLVTSGKKRQALDVWLDSLGRRLCELGYTIQPCLSGGAVSWIIVRKGRQKWTLTYFETMTGLSVDTGRGIASHAERDASLPKHAARYLWSATAAVQRASLAGFGVALSPTVGMTAMQAARVSLPPGFRKWRPDPLLVSMERDGRGYRGGMTYAQRWRGPAIQVDITRQYTAALAGVLPREWGFGRFPGYADARPGVYMCRVRMGRRLPYPIGIWSGPEHGFIVDTVSDGEYVCVLHTPEIHAIIRAGGSVWPTYGFIAGATFSAGGYVAGIQDILSEHGRDHPLSKLTKPLGNYVYGKFGQNPERDELLYSVDNPGKSWWPYFDEYGKEWNDVWERKVARYSSTQHVDLAGWITSIARAQTVEAWVSLLDAGVNVVRVHTDSLTVDRLPESFPLSDGSEIGKWRIEKPYRETIICGANAYFDADGAHIAGVSRPTYEMVERLWDHGIAQVSQRVRTPRRGFHRGEREDSREIRATAR